MLPLGFVQQGICNMAGLVLKLMIFAQSYLVIIEYLLLKAATSHIPGTLAENFENRAKQTTRLKIQ